MLSADWSISPLTLATCRAPQAKTHRGLTQSVHVKHKQSLNAVNTLRVRVLTLVVTAQRNHFLTLAGFTVKNKTTIITPQTESVLLTGSSSTSVSASSSGVSVSGFGSGHWYLTMVSSVPLLVTVMVANGESSG